MLAQNPSFGLWSIFSIQVFQHTRSPLTCKINFKEKSYDCELISKWMKQFLDVTIYYSTLHVLLCNVFVIKYYNILGIFVSTKSYIFVIVIVIL